VLLVTGSRRQAVDLGQLIDGLQDLAGIVLGKLLAAGQDGAVGLILPVEFVCLRNFMSRFPVPIATVLRSRIFSTFPKILVVRE
jgi:hypothetical protein